MIQPRVLGASYKSCKYESIVQSQKSPAPYSDAEPNNAGNESDGSKGGDHREDTSPHVPHRYATDVLQDSLHLEDLPTGTLLYHASLGCARRVGGIATFT